MTVIFMASYTRRLSTPKRSFLLLGPRGTGKTTWLRTTLPRAHVYNLLLDREYLRLLRDPGILRHEIEALPRGAWIAIDEVQRLPALLNEVHDALSAGPTRWRFALTGSSARKLRRENVNLLAGRLVMRKLLPLTATELGALPALDELLRFGMLPVVRTARSMAERVDLLEAYVETYLSQEIRAEALVRNLDSFSRFLEVTALANAQVTNVSALARDAGVARPTISGYFEVLTDTLLGTWLPAWRPRAKVKEAQHPKFYLFDTGVARALARRLREPVEAAERGPLLETFVHHELRAQIAYADCGGELSYYRTPSGTEIDFIWTRGSHAVGIEVKASERWRPEFGRALEELVNAGVVLSAHAVYLGARPLRIGAITVWPVKDFLRELAAGRVLSLKRTPPRRSKLR
jgi:predicted AAA+ superfamily ATPase